ncbi:hypothetical protein ABZW18_13930 [Streptomyces sp. NPDC004647]|uniref:hypothetical protein n=1 Tax=Streptomyces sp. NPDC004647 TaxID=3154671 RepID=UPI0033BEFE52
MTGGAGAGHQNTGPSSSVPSGGSRDKDGHPTAPGGRPANPSAAPSGSPATATPGNTSSGPVESPAPATDGTSSAGTPGTGATPAKEPSPAGEAPPARETPGPRGTPTTGETPALGTPSSRHPGAARFDIEAARARLEDPSVPQDRRDTSLQWAADAVLDRIGRVAPGENPLGVVPRVDEVVELVAAEHLRGGHLPATALLGSLVRGPQPLLPPPPVEPAPQGVRLAPPSAPEPETAPHRPARTAPDPVVPSFRIWPFSVPSPARPVSAPSSSFHPPVQPAHTPASVTPGAPVSAPGHSSATAGALDTSTEHGAWRTLFNTPGTSAAEQQGLLDRIGAHRGGAVPSPEELELRRFVHEQLAAQPGVTVVVDDAANYGHQAAATMLMESLHELGYSGRITVIAPDSVRERLQLLVSDTMNQRIDWHTGTFGSDTPVPGAQVAGANDSLVLVAASDRLDTGIDTATQFLNFVGADRAIILKPYAWGDSRRMVYSRPGPDGPVTVHDLEAGGTGAQPIPDSALYRFHVPRLTGDDLRALINAQVGGARGRGLWAVAEAVQGARAELMPVYGLHNVAAPGRASALNTLAAGVHEAGLRSPSVVMTFGDATVSFAPRHSETWLHYADLDDPQLETQIRDLGPGDVLVVNAGKLPQDVFRQVYQLGGLPAVLEGANTSNLVQITGRPFFSVDTHHTPYDPFVPAAADRLQGVTDAIVHESEWGRGLHDAEGWADFQTAHTARSVLGSLPEQDGGRLLGADEMHRVRQVLPNERITGILGSDDTVQRMLDYDPSDYRQVARQESNPDQVVLTSTQWQELKNAVGAEYSAHENTVRDDTRTLSVAPGREQTLTVAGAITDSLTGGASLHDYFRGLASQARDPRNDQVLQALDLVFSGRYADSPAGPSSYPPSVSAEDPGPAPAPEPESTPPSPARTVPDPAPTPATESGSSAHPGNRQEPSTTSGPSGAAAPAEDSDSGSEDFAMGGLLDESDSGSVDLAMGGLLDESDSGSVDLAMGSLLSPPASGVGAETITAEPGGTSERSAPALSSQPVASGGEFHAQHLSTGESGAPPAPLADLATRLPGMTPEDRTRELTLLPSGQLDALAADQELIANLRQQLPPAEFADTAAQLLVRVPEGVEQPVSARTEAQSRIAGMLADPDVAESLLGKGTRVIVIPRDVPLTSLGPFAALGGTHAGGRALETVRGINHDRQVAVTEENLLGETTQVPGDGAYPDGYSTTTHEFAHAIHEKGGLSKIDLARIASAYRAREAEGAAAHWPDGPLRDPSGVRPGANYSSHNQYEYFAQLSNAYLGTNTGTDPYTGAPRNNGVSWVRQHEPGLLPLLERLYGPPQQTGNPANPFTAVQAENETWAGFRGLWDRAEQELRPQHHVPVPPPADQSPQGQPEEWSGVSGDASDDEGLFAAPLRRGGAGVEGAPEEWSGVSGDASDDEGLFAAPLRRGGAGVEGAPEEWSGVSGDASDDEGLFAAPLRRSGAGPESVPEEGSGVSRPAGDDTGPGALVAPRDSENGALGVVDGTASRPVPPRLSELMPEADWWLLYIDPRDHALALEIYPDDPGKLYDRQWSPGFQQSMIDAYRAALDSPEGLANRMNAAEYLRLHNLVVANLDARPGWSGGQPTSFPLRNTQLSQDLLEEELGGRRLALDLSNYDWPATAARPITALESFSTGKPLLHTNYAVGEVARLVDMAFDRYYTEAAQAHNDLSRLAAIGKAVRALQVIHPFHDTNRRLNVHLLLHKLLIEQGFRPVVTPKLASLFQGGYSVEQMAETLLRNTEPLRPPTQAPTPQDELNTREDELSTRAAASESESAPPSTVSTASTPSPAPATDSGNSVPTDHQQQPTIAPATPQAVESSAGSDSASEDFGDFTDLLAAPPTTTTVLEEPATQAPPTTQTPGATRILPVEDQLAERGLSPVYVPAGADDLAHALIAVAPEESGQLVGQSRPATAQELRAEVADAVAADLRRAPAERRLLPGTAAQGSADRIVQELRTGSGPASLDWLTLGGAAHGLGLRITVLAPDRAPWTVGPADGRPVVLVRQERPEPHVGRWVATEPVAAAEQARHPGQEPQGEASGFTWGSTSSAAVRPAADSGPAQTQVFFGADPRPAEPDSAFTTAAAPAHEPGEGTSRGPAASGSGGSGRAGGSGSGSGSGEAPVPHDGDGDATTSRTLSPYVRGYGSRHDGLVGLVLHEPVPEDVLGALHQHVLDALGVAPGSAAEAAVREQLAEQLSPSEIALHLPDVRSMRGHRVTVTVDGTEHTVDVRLRLADPRPATHHGTLGEVPRTTKVERQGEGGQSSSAGENSGTMRTVPIPWIGIYNGPAGPLRWFDGALTLTLTHNQLSQSAAVSEGVTTTTMQRANDPAHAVDFTGRWQARVDTDRNAPVDTWGAERGHGRLTVWFPEHRAFGHGGAGGPLPEPAGLDDLPLWGVDAVSEPSRLLDDVLDAAAFAALRDLGADSRRELEEFLSERMLRGTLPMQRDRGVYSPVLLDGSGNALGVLRLAATVRPRKASSQTPDGRFTLESWLTHSSGVDRSARLTSGIGLDGSGGPMFTPDHAPGHPSAATRIGGGVFGKAGVSWQSSDALNTSSTASLMHALYTDSTHLLVPADITYRITLVRPGGGEITRSYGPRQEGVQLRLPQRSTATGHAPAPEEQRRPPGHLEHLDSIGFSAVPLAVHGAERMFERAEEWLRREGFLPPREHGWYAMNEPRVQTQLANLRRFEQLRSRLGQAAALPDAVEGGRPVWFELPGHLSGSRRVQLRFTAARDRTPRPGEAGAPPAVHTRRLPDVESAGFSSHEARGTRQRGTRFGGTMGGGGGPRWPLADGGWALDSTGDYTWGGQHSSSATAGSALGMDQFTITTSGGTELFAVPARFALDLYEGSAEDPLVRFADPASDPESAPASGQAARPQPAPIGPLGLPAAQATQTTLAGHVTLAVPHQRTLPAEGHIVPPPARDVIRAPRTGGGPQDDTVRLGLTDAAGQPQPGLIRLPDDAIVDTFRGSAALREAFRQLVTGTYPGRPPAGAFGRRLHTFSSRVPDLVTAPGTWLGEYLAGPAAGNQGAFAGEVLHQQVRVANLLARAQQIFNGGYLIEGLVLPGLGADQELSLEITGYLHHPTHSGSFRSYGESDLTASDASTRQRSVATSHQRGGGLTALQAAPTPPAGSPPPRVSQANPSMRVAGSRRTETASERSAGTSVVRVPLESGDQHLVTADATLLVTLRQGTRNLFGNFVGLGSRDGITVAIDLPRAVQFTLATSQLARYARWFAGVPGLPRPVLPHPTVPLPDHFVRTRELGVGGVLSVTQLDDPVRRNESRDRLHRELLALVEREAPGVTRPGHAAYLPGVATRIADLTAPAALRALPARGTVRLWFRYATTGGTRLVEVTLNARPDAQTPALRRMRGRPAGDGTGLEQTGIHAPDHRAESQGATRTWQVTATPISRYPRPGGRTGRTDRTGPVLSASTTRGRTSRTDFSSDDRYWTRTGNAADFDDIGYTLTGSVRSELIWDWPPDLVGGLLENGWVSLTARDGGGLAQRLARMVRGRPAREVRVPAAVALRFVGAEAVAPRPHDPPVRPRTTHADPRLPAPHGPLPAGGRPFAAGPPLVPTGPTPVFEFNGFRQLAEALRTVAPGIAGAWGLSADAPPEAAAARFGELVQAGRITVDLSRTAVGLTSTMPGAWPVGSDPEETPVLQVTLHNPRPVTDAEDVAVDRLRRPSRSSSSSSTVGSAAGMGYQFTQSGNQANLHLVSFTTPLLTRQSVSRTGGASASAGQRDRLKTGAPARSETGTNTRSYETLVDAVVTVTGPEGIRYVTGSATVRLFERDLLGHGVIGPRTASQVYDLPSMLARQPDAALRDWTRHPVTELPAALAGELEGQESGAQLWLDLGPDPDGRRLARALYVGSRTAQAAGRPVELVLRGGTGLRFWPFTADGRLADLTPATTDAWNRLRTAVITATDAAAAEADAAGHEAELRPREARAAEELATAQAALTATTTAHTSAAGALTEARTARQSLADRLGEAERVQAEAERAADRRDEVVTTAEERLAEAEQALRRAREEAARNQPVASGADGTASQTGPDPEAVSAAESARDAARVERDIARGVAAAAREVAERAAGTVAELQERLAAAEERVRTATDEERTAAGAVTRGTASRDERHQEHQRLGEELRNTRQEQADQQRLRQDAWAQMPGLAGMLSADRCREGTGGSRFPLDSLSSAPGGPGS